VAGIGEALRPAIQDLEIVLVNDGSPGPAWERICAIAARAPYVRGIDLVRNFGQHNALLAGIRASKGEVVVTMDDDLQHPPSEIPALLEALEGGADLVYGTPREARHTVFRNATSVSGKVLLSMVFGASMARQISAFRAFRGVLRRLFEDFRSPDVSLDVLLSWGAVRVGSVPVRHDARHAGRSQYTLAKLVRHWVNMVFGFTTWPLRLASVTGFVFLLFGGVVLLWVLGRYLMLGGSVPGFPFLACLITIFSGVQLFSLGVIGEYMARLYLRGLDRPPYVVRTTVNLGA
jgi:undecaprenyl-phosphate 4-deoxy-4-formamido-L-arabinose transferase